jgi:hypothetical protein
MTPKPGRMAVLTKLPPGFLNDLPTEDQRAISEIVGKPILLNKYEEDGRAELEFTDQYGVIHFIYVRPEFLRSSY